MATILVVDDRPINRQYLVMLLRHFGHQILDASDGAEALELARTEHPDLIILDIVMPRMGGGELASRLRAEPDLADIPLIFYTASYEERAARELAQEHNVSGVIVKPADPEEAIKIVNAALAVRSTGLSPEPGGQPSSPSAAVSENGAAVDAVSARFSTIIDLGLELMAEVDPVRLLDKVAQVACWTLGAEVAALGILDPDRPMLRHYRIFRRGSHPRTPPKPPTPREGVLERILEQRRPFRLEGIVDDVADLGLAPDHPPVHSFLGVPIATPEEAIGWLYVTNKQRAAGFNDEDERLATTLAVQLGGRLETLRLLEQARLHASQLESEILEHQQATAALRESEERFRQLAENIRECFWLAMPNATGVLYVSPAYESIWQRSAASLYAAPGEWVEAIHPEDRPRVLAALEAKQARGDYDEIYRIVRPDGSARWIRDRAFPVRDAKGQVYRVAGIAEDITELKLAETQLRQAAKMEALGHLAGGVAHDFNNLLTVIIGYVNLTLSRLREGDPLRHYLGEILKAGESAAALTRQLLAFSRKQVVALSSLDLNGIVRDADTLLQRLIGADVQLVTRFAPSLRIVKADPSQVEQVILNLAVNARDAMPQGGTLTLETANVELDSTYAAAHVEVRPGLYSMLAISDTGCGMSAEIQSHLFEPFFTTKEPGKGTGLGLATVYGIMKQSAGHVSVYSEPGAGTTFRVYFPALEQSAEKKELPSVAVPRRGSETILMVEDNDLVRELAQHVLEMYDYKVLQARNGDEAIGICQAHSGRIHALMTDMIMPGMSGKELAQRVVQLRPGIAVLYVSGYASELVSQRGILEEGVAFLQKPFTPEALARKLRDILDAPAAADGGREGNGA